MLVHRIGESLQRADHGIVVYCNLVDIVLASPIDEHVAGNDQPDIVAREVVIEIDKVLCGSATPINHAL
jgi:hypothetical protein